MDDHDVVGALAVEWARWTREPEFPWKPNHCINGTRVAIEVLRHFGVRARPASVNFVLFNQFAFELAGASVPVDDWPPQAWSVGVQAGQRSADGEWHGHLVVDGGEWWFDPSSQSFDRPGRIDVPLPFLLDAPLPPVGYEVELHMNHGLVLVVSRWPENNAWRAAAGWTRPNSKERNLMIDRVTRRLEL